MLIFMLLVTPAYGSVDFAGSTSCLSSSSTVTLGVETITVAFWGKYTSGSDTIMVELTSQFFTNDNAFMMSMDSTATQGSCDGSGVEMTIQRGGFSFRQECLTTPPSTGVWHHYALVIDLSVSTGDVKLYVDGEEEALALGLNQIVSSADLRTDTWFIAARNCASSGIDMQMDEFYIFSGELAAAEIRNLYSSRTKRVGLQVDNAVIVYLSLDECTDTVTCSGTDQFVDGSGNGNHFTASNSPIGEAGRLLSYP